MDPLTPADLAAYHARREATITSALAGCVPVRKGGAPFPFNVIPSDGGALGGGVRLGQPYAESGWVQAAIKHIAKPITMVDLEFYRAGGAETPLADPRLAAFWKRPARRIASLAQFVVGTVGWRKLAGEAFWLLDDTALVPFPEVQSGFPQLILARPDRMRHVEADGELTGWEFTDGRGRRHLLTAEQVIHLKQWNPYDEFRGLGEYEAACLAARTEAANERFQLALAESNGDQGVYIVAKSGIPDDPQKAQIVAQLREKRALQQRGIFKPVFLGGDISVEDPQVRAVDVAFHEGSRLSAEKIFTIFGVPPSMASKTASYSIGSASDYYRLILDACQPEAAELEAGVSQVSSRLLGQEVEGEWNWDEHPVMQEVRKERLASATGLWGQGMPMVKVSEYLDLGLPRFDGDDVGYLPFSVAPVNGAMPPEHDPAFQEPVSETPAPNSDPVTEALRALRSPRSSISGAPTPICAKATAAGAAAWRQHMAKRRESVRTYERAFTRVLFAARAEVLRKLESRDTAGRATLPQDAADAPETASGGLGRELKAIEGQGGGLSGGVEPPLTTRAGAFDFLFDLDTFQRGLKAAFRGAGQNALDTAGKQLFAELAQDDPFTFPPAKAIQFLQTRENRLADIGDDIHDRIKAVLQDGLNAGDSTKALAELVRGEFNELSRSRATTIAMTETAAAYGVARQEGMAQAGVQWKQWLTSGAENVREAHRAANGQTVAVDDHFSVGGEQLAHPGDPHGSAGNVINCHCVCIAVATGPEEAS